MATPAQKNLVQQQLADNRQAKNARFKWGFSGKTGWEWLNLIAVLLVPVLLGLATFIFTWQQAQNSLDQQRADTLQTYLDNIQDLLLNHDLLKANFWTVDNNLHQVFPYRNVALLADARTLTALQGLDPRRRTMVVQFLYNTKLINGKPVECMNCEPSSPIIDLSGDDLSGVDLSGSDWNGIDLGGANLSHADLSHAGLEGANLSNANLSDADLSDAYFDVAALSHADLSGADLSGSNISLQQFDQVRSCLGAVLPSELICHQTPHQTPSRIDLLQYLTALAIIIWIGLLGRYLYKRLHVSPMI